MDMDSNVVTVLVGGAIFVVLIVLMAVMVVWARRPGSLTQ